MTFATALLLAALSILASALGRGDLGLLLAVVATIVGLEWWIDERRSERRDARRRNRR